MISIENSIEIRRPAEEVFDFIADWANNPKWQNGMKRCTWTSNPPLRLGSTYDQEAEFRGRSIRSSFEVIEYQPGRKLRIRTTTSTMPLDITRMVEPAADGTARVTAVVRGGPGGIMRLFSPLMAAMVRRSIRADYRRLAELLEST